MTTKCLHLLSQPTDPLAVRLVKFGVSKNGKKSFPIFGHINLSDLISYNVDSRTTLQAGGMDADFSDEDDK
jgi:hypothetical protein